jgi:GcrA cell cycle regulator
MAYNLWTEEQIVMLAKLWNDGLGTAEIGRRMELSKSTIIGKAHRLGLAPRPSPIAPRKKSDKIAAKPPAEPAKAPTCSWPIGHPREEGFRLCGEPREARNKPYCALHHAKATVKVNHSPEAVQKREAKLANVRLWPR